MGNDGFTLNSNVYNFLKWMALVLLPALGALYFGLAALWRLPAAESVVGTITVVDTFLGLLVSKTAGTFAQKQVVGDIVVRQDVDGTPVGMELVAHQDPLILKDQSQVVMNVVRKQAF